MKKVILMKLITILISFSITFPAFSTPDIAKKIMPSIFLLMQDEEKEEEEEKKFLNVDIKLVDSAMNLPVPTKGGAYKSSKTDSDPSIKYENSVGYGKNAPVALFLTLLAYDNPNKLDSSGNSVMARAVEHLRNAVSDKTHPEFQGGHAAWFDMYIPIAWGIARRTPAMWNQFTAEEKKRVDILMRHCLHAANIFLNTNDAKNKLSFVFYDMKLKGAGTLPNQSASFHAYGIGAYIYFGGTSGMTAALNKYSDEFSNELRNITSDGTVTTQDINTWHEESEGFIDIAELYEKKYGFTPRNQANADERFLTDLLKGEKLDNDLFPDPQGVKKPLIELNTRSITDSPAGFEHPYRFSHKPLPATPTGIFQRWGHEFTVASMPKTNVGPDKSNKCGGADLGLLGGTLPYEGEGRGMPFELNVHSFPVNGVTSKHIRSSWDYASWGVQQYALIFSALSITGYWDVNNAQHQEILERVERSTTIWRYIGHISKGNSGLNGWKSSAGPSSQVCTRDHHDAYHVFGANDLAQGMLQALSTDPDWDSDRNKLELKTLELDPKLFKFDPIVP